MTGEQGLLRAPIGVRLRADTHELHVRAERTLDFLTQHAEAADYLTYLERWHGFHRALEPRLDSWHSRERLLDWPRRRKLPLVEADLLALGLRQDAITMLPTCPDVPVVDSTAAALGVLYVVEGSTLGGTVLLRRLRNPRIPEEAHHFLSSYGGEVGRLWCGYRRAADAWVADHPDQEDEVVAAARRTFEVLIRWLAPSRGST